MSHMEVMAFQRKVVFHLKYIFTTHLPFLTCAFLPHAKNPQFDLIWFAQGSYIFTYIDGPKRKHYIFT
jgi:hypothetical protein